MVGSSTAILNSGSLSQKIRQIKKNHQIKTIRQKMSQNQKNIGDNIRQGTLKNVKVHFLSMIPILDEVNLGS